MCDDEAAATRTTPAIVPLRDQADSRGGEVCAKNKHRDPSRCAGSCLLRQHMFPESRVRTGVSLQQMVTSTRRHFSLELRHSLSKLVFITCLIFLYCSYNISLSFCNLLTHVQVQGPGLGEENSFGIKNKQITGLIYSI